MHIGDGFYSWCNLGFQGPLASWYQKAVANETGVESPLWAGRRSIHVSHWRIQFCLYRNANAYTVPQNVKSGLSRLGTLATRFMKD